MQCLEGMRLARLQLSKALPWDSQDKLHDTEKAMDSVILAGCIAFASFFQAFQPKFMNLQNSASGSKPSLAETPSDEP